MDFLKGLVGQPAPAGSAASGAAPAGAGNAGLLGDWQDYSRTADVEAGNTSAVQDISRQAQDMGTSIFGALRSGYQQVSDGVTNIQAPSLDTSWVPSTTQITYFVVLMGSALVFLSMSVFVFLPIIIIAPAKFALCFTIGCMCALSALGALRGWEQVKQMLTRDRLPYTAAYISSMLATLWAALFMHSYILSLVFSALQLLALCVFVSAYAGGSEAAQRMLSMSLSAGSACFGTVRAAVLR